MRELCVERLAMSTRVALPMHVGCKMSELRRQLLPSPTPSQDRTAQVRKNLFGPIDHDENIKFVQDELDKISQADCQRWNFDFQAEKPKEGRYNWEPVEEGVPQAYEMSRLTYLTTHATTTTHSSSSSTHATTPLAAPTPVRKVPEGVGTSSTTTTTAATTTTTTTTISTTVDQPSTSTQATTTTTTPTSSTTISTTISTTTTTVLDKTASQTTARLPTPVSGASTPASASEAATSKSIREVVVKKFMGDADEKLDKREHKPLSVLRCTRSRSSQPPLTAFMKIHKTKRPASSKLEEEQPPALVKRPRTSSS
ncbi:uncharacterized protein [Panulirus ornatus]|uniref:uncharacterized protein n=1 Tax=Panulirus ornatus TaxID=150431 RepID=UPI003A83DDC7